MSFTEHIFQLKADQLCQQIRNIRRLVNQFKGYRELHPFVELINDELENSEKIIEEKGCEVTDFNNLVATKEDVSRHVKGIFSRIMDTLGNQETRLVISEQILSQMSVWESQRKNSSVLSDKHRMLEKFGDDMCDMVEIKTPVISNFGAEFRSIPCESYTFQLSGYITNVPEAMANQIDAWAILAHELGHVYYHENYSMMKESINDPLELHIRSLGIKKEDANEMIDVWNSRWIPELVSDVVATLTLGPAYAEKAVVDALGVPPTEFSPQSDSHPPWKIRINLILEVLQKLHLKEYSINEKKSFWKEYIEMFLERTEPEVTNLFLNRRTVEKAAELIILSIRISPIEKIWQNALDIKKGKNTEGCSVTDLVQAYFIESDEGKRKKIEQVILAKC